MAPAWRYFAISGLLAAIVSTPEIHYLSAHDQSTVLEFYQRHLREPLFVGLLTVAAFLFSLKTFIIVTMKENVYDAKVYGDKLELLRQLDPTLKRYGPLEDFSMLLFLSVLLSLISAVIQFTIGLFDAPWAAAVSIDTAIWSIAMIFVSLIYMQLNLKAWFGLLDGGD